jgi:hypothetical protein
MDSGLPTFRRLAKTGFVLFLLLPLTIGCSGASASDNQGAAISLEADLGEQLWRTVELLSPLSQIPMFSSTLFKARRRRVNHYTDLLRMKLLAPPVPRQ